MRTIRSKPACRPSRAGIVPAAIAALVIPLAAAQANEGAFTVALEDPGLEWAPCPDFMPEGCGLAILQGSPAEPNVDVFFRLPGNSTADRHWHTSAERMVLVAGELRVEYDGQDPVTMRPGTYAYGPAQQPHVAACASSTPCVLFIAFEEPLDAIAGAPDGSGLDGMP